MDSFKAWIPVTIDIDKILLEHPPKQKLKRDKLLYIVHLLRTIRTVDRRNMVGGEWILINATALKNVISDYKPYLLYLEGVGLIICDGKGKKGVRSHGYKFTQLNYIAVPTIIIELTDATLLTALKKAWARDNHGTDYVKKHLPYLYKHFYNGKLIIDIPKEISTNYSITNAVNSIKSGRPRLSVDKFGRRLHTPITRLNKELRKHLSYDGHKLVEVDIKCSQPYLSIKVIIEQLNKKNKNLINRIKEAESLESKLEVIRGLKGCKGLYEYIYDILVDDIYIKLKDEYEANNEYQIGNGERDDYKEIVFQIMYSRNGFKSNLKTSFKKIYNYPFSILYNIKKDDHKDLSKKLQKLESSLLLRTICKRVNQHDKNIPMFTIHDSILTTQKHYGIVENIVKEVLLEEIGFEPILHVKKY